MSKDIYVITHQQLLNDILENTDIFKKGYPKLEEMIDALTNNPGSAPNRMTLNIIMSSGIFELQKRVPIYKDKFLVLDPTREGSEKHKSLVTIDTTWENLEETLSDVAEDSGPDSIKSIVQNGETYKIIFVRSFIDGFEKYEEDREEKEAGEPKVENNEQRDSDDKEEPSDESTNKEDDI